MLFFKTLILFIFNTLRGLSFFSNTFSNLSLNNNQNQLKISSDNPLNDPNPIINFGKNTFSSINSGLITLNFSSTTIIRFEENSLKTDYLSHKIYFKDIIFIKVTTNNTTFNFSSTNI